MLDGATDIKNESLKSWIDQLVQLCEPSAVHWCDGSEHESDALIADMVARGTLIKLDPRQAPAQLSVPVGSARRRSRREPHLHLFTTKKNDAGPTNNWVDPEQMKARMTGLYRGAMRGRTLYVIPFSMGPIGSPDRADRRAADRLALRRGQHADHDPHGRAGPRPARRPQGLRALPALGRRAAGARPEGRGVALQPRATRTSRTSPRSARSGRSAAATAATRCSERSASRCASPRRWAGTKAGWPSTWPSWASRRPPVRRTYVAAAFPSACGKTNFAMMLPPAGFEGWKVTTVGDDIAWIKPGQDGRLYAINPENGFFGVAPGHQRQEQPERDGRRSPPTPSSPTSRSPTTATCGGRG